MTRLNHSPHCALRWALLLLLLGSFAPASDTSFGRASLLNEGCRFTLDEVAGAEAPRLELSCDEVALRRGGVAMVVVQLLDAAGTRLMGTTDEVACAVEGPAQLLGLEASRNQDMGAYTDAAHNPSHSRMVAYIRADDMPGDAFVRFRASGLPEAAIVLEVR